MKKPKFLKKLYHIYRRNKSNLFLLFIIIFFITTFIILVISKETNSFLYYLNFYFHLIISIPITLKCWQFLREIEFETYGPGNLKKAVPSDYNKYGNSPGDFLLYFIYKIGLLVFTFLFILYNPSKIWFIIFSLFFYAGYILLYFNNASKPSEHIIDFKYSVDLNNNVIKNIKTNYKLKNSTKLFSSIIEKAKKREEKYKYGLRVKI